MTVMKVVNRKGASYSNNNFSDEQQTLTYQRKTLSANDDYIDSQFQKPPPRIPSRSILLAFLLCGSGIVLLLMGVLSVTGHLDSKYDDRFWPLIIMGLLTFIPGFYHTRIFFYVLKGVPGYSIEDIPEFE